MKKILLVLTCFLIILTSTVAVVVVTPYYIYNKVLHDDYRSDWYSLPSFQEKFLKASAPVKGSADDLGNNDLWKKFHFMDVVIPMPVHNPFFYISPILSFNQKSQITNFGIRLYSEGNRDISKLFFIRNRLFPNVLKSQKLFKLPLVKNELMKHSKVKIWKDIFTKQISGWNIPFSEMAYNLYIIQLRSKILPGKFKKYSLVKDSTTAIIELESVNKDYITEMILTYSRGLIYSFILLTEKENSESKLVRYKFLNEVQFRGGSSRLSKILYLEYKSLSYRDQIDHKGMLYLLSAWTHSMEKGSYIREMIESLEKGQKNQRQLEALYRYSLKRYNTTFTTRKIDGLEISNDITLRRNIEIEKIEDDKKYLEQLPLDVPKSNLSEEQKIKNLLKDVKENKKTESDTIIID